MAKFIIVGTSHIARQSIAEIKKTIENEKPSVIAVELDAMRLQSLITNKSKIELRMIIRVGVKGFIFALIGSYIQKKLGKIAGLAPGSDMLSAVKEAGKR